MLGERIWVSGGEQAVTTRIAVHAVRRIEGATVLDWSITPLQADGYEVGDSLPIELGLVRPWRSNPAIVLIDVEGKQAYQPLAHQSRRLFNHCLCTPTVGVPAGATARRDPAAPGRLSAAAR